MNTTEIIDDLLDQIASIDSSINEWKWIGINSYERVFEKNITVLNQELIKINKHDRCSLRGVTIALVLLTGTTLLKYILGYHVPALLIPALSFGAIAVFSKYLMNYFVKVHLEHKINLLTILQKVKERHAYIVA